MGDQLPHSPAGITVSVADKVDSLVGLIGAGCAPSASADPYGLRRTANGLLQVTPCCDATLTQCNHIGHLALHDAVCIFYAGVLTVLLMSPCELYTLFCSISS